LAVLICCEWIYLIKATAEMIVMKVNEFNNFRRKRQAILGWKEGFIGSRGDNNPIIYIEDTGHCPRNGCRLPKNQCIFLFLFGWLKKFFFTWMKI